MKTELVLGLSERLELGRKKKIKTIDETEFMYVGDTFTLCRLGFSRSNTLISTAYLHTLVDKIAFFTRQLIMLLIQLG